jgi:hypothetical protein
VHEPLQTPFVPQVALLVHDAAVPPPVAAWHQPAWVASTGQPLTASVGSLLVQARPFLVPPLHVAPEIQSAFLVHTFPLLVPPKHLGVKTVPLELTNMFTLEYVQAPLGPVLTGAPVQLSSQGVPLGTAPGVFPLPAFGGLNVLPTVLVVAGLQLLV